MEDLTPNDRTLRILEGLSELLEHFEEHKDDEKTFQQIKTTFEWIGKNLDKEVVKAMVLENELACAGAIVDLLDTQLAYGYH